MSNYILVAVAWPYANSDIHVGNITGSYLPADIFARFNRLLGNHVLMVSGSDAHGTPVAVRADAEGISPAEVYERFHLGFITLFQKLGLSYDLFTTTHTENHAKVSQSIFLALKENNYLYTKREQQWYSTSQNRFLPDRFIEGTCYLCGYENARGDQCDGCGSLLDATQLINPRSKIDNSVPTLLETEHFYLDLGALEPDIVAFLREREGYWRPNVLRQSLGQILAKGLHGRAITRDLDWGISVPVDGWDGKCLYVWFEAVIGYLSAAIEWASINHQDDIWEEWWFNPAMRSYYFIGKDNIPFHTVFFPAMLMGQNTPYKLPDQVPANEFLLLEGKQFSKSEGWYIDLQEFLNTYTTDQVRYYLASIAPETSDSDFSFKGFLGKCNSDLLGKLGNLVHRTLTFAKNFCEAKIP